MSRRPGFIRRLSPPRLLLVRGVVEWALLLYAPFVIGQWLTSLCLGPEWPAYYVEPAKAFLSVLLRAAAVAYGLGRLCKYHPSWHPAYAKWLEQTPWHAAKPLPLGPVQWEWRDVLPIAAIALLAHFHLGTNPAIPLALMAFSYLVVAAVTLANSKAPAPAVVLAFGLPVMVLLMDRPAHALLAALPLLAVAALGVRQSMARFPWKAEEAPTGLPTTQSLRSESLGWPLDRIAPKPMAESVSQGAGWLFGALIGWWLFVLLTRFGLGDDATSQSFAFEPIYRALVIAAGALAFLRALRYAMGHRWPISLLSRVLSGRLILPRYDYIVLAPVCVALVGVVTPPVLRAAGLRVEAIAGVTLTLVIAAALNLGPTVRSWSLTGAYHMVRVTKNGPEVQPNVGANRHAEAA
jgi:hypothetical protein